jgi:DNA-binding NtrC family response regulator
MGGAVIHLASPRADRPFETLDCSAPPKDLAAAPSTT